MISIPGKIPITISPLFWLLAALIGWLSSNTISGTLIAMVVIFFSVLFHEFGHALTASVFKQKTRIHLAAFGGFTYRQGRKLKLWEEFLVVFNGPLAGILLFLISFGMLEFASITNATFLFVLKFTGTVNLFWTVVNLVPVLPLDGGHLLSIILEGIFGFKGVKIAIFVGLVFSIGLSIFFFVIGAFLLGALFVILMFESIKSVRYYKMMTEKDRDSDLQTLMQEGEKEFKAGNEEVALQKLEAVRNRTKKGILYTMATEETAQILKHQGRLKEAYEELQSVEKHLSKEILPLFQFLAFHNRDYKKACELAKETYQMRPTAEMALLNARCFAALQDIEPTVGWLECALREGFLNLKEEITKREFDSVREDPTFQKFSRTL